LPSHPVATIPELVNYNAQTPPVSANAGAWSTPWTTGSFPTVSASNVTIGPRVLKVYVLPSSVTTTSQFDTYVSNSANPIYASTTLNVTLTPGAQTINLVLPHYSP